MAGGVQVEGGNGSEKIDPFWSPGVVGERVVLGFNALEKGSKRFAVEGNRLLACGWIVVVGT